MVSELTVFCGAMVGASIGFLWYNAHPAEIFMGDVGSLALGGAIGTVALIIRQELLLPFIGGIFVLETLSVMLQVGSYKLRKKRIFKMAPLHHHFEQLGWHESKVIARFCILSAGDLEVFNGKLQPALKTCLMDEEDGKFTPETIVYGNSSANWATMVAALAPIFPYKEFRPIIDRSRAEGEDRPA